MATFVIEQTDSIQRASISSGGRSAGMALRSGAASPMVTAWAQVQNEIASKVNDLKPAALARALAESVTNHVIPAWKLGQASIQSEKREQAARLARLTAVDGLDSVQAVADRSDFKALSGIADQMRWITSANREMLAAVFGGERSRFPAVRDDDWQAGVQRLARLSFIEQAGVLARYPVQPTAESPAPIGADHAAAEDFAEKQFQAFKAEQAATAHAERALADTLNMLAVAFDVPTGREALAALQAMEAA